MPQTTYDASGRATQRLLGADKPGISVMVQVDYIYDPWRDVDETKRGRLEEIRASTTGVSSMLQDLHYTYDGVGNIASIQDLVAADTQLQHFEYDELNRLTHAYTNFGSHQYDDRFGYGQQTDPNGKIGNLVTKGPNGNPVLYSYGQQSSDCEVATSELTKAHAVVTAGNDWYCYDPNGNQVKRTVSGVTFDLTYDQENRLIEDTGNDQTTTFVYDGDGNRVQKTAGGETTIYIGNYFEWNVNEASMVKYYYAGGERVAMRTNVSTWYMLLKDHLGSTALTVNAGTGQVVGESHYKPFGEVWYPTDPSMQTDYRFTGQRLEKDLGLYDFGARFYDPKLGRFVQADTIVPADSKQVAITPLQVGSYELQDIAGVGAENQEISQAGFPFQRDDRTRSQTKQHAGPSNPQMLNRYAYALNNPIQYIDSTGHTPITFGQLLLLEAALMKALGIGEPVAFLAGFGIDIAADIIGEIAKVGSVIGAFFSKLLSLPLDVTYAELEKIYSMVHEARLTASALAPGDAVIDLDIGKVSKHSAIVYYFSLTVSSKSRLQSYFNQFNSCTNSFSSGICLLIVNNGRVSDTDLVSYWTSVTWSSVFTSDSIYGWIGDIFGSSRWTSQLLETISSR